MNLPPTDAELTMREEGWILSKELFDQPEPPIVSAFRLLYSDHWERFRLDLDGNFALTFFNTEIPDFAYATTWEALAKEYGIVPYGECWRISPDMHEHARSFCRWLRAVAASDGPPTQSPRHSKRPLFLTSGSFPKVAVIQHYGGCLMPYLDIKLNNPQPDKCEAASLMLESLDLHRRITSDGSTYVYVNNQTQY